MKSKAEKIIVIVAIVVFALLALGYVVSKYLVTNMEQSTVFSVREMRNDDSTYYYVREQCASGNFAQDSVNCRNLRAAR